MSTGDNSSDAQSLQAQIEILSNAVAALMRLAGPSVPAICANGLYTREQVQRNLSVSDHTVGHWIEFNDLQAFQPGTSKQLIFGQDLIDWLKAHPSGVVKPKTAREKHAMRKAKGK